MCAGSRAAWGQVASLDLERYLAARHVSVVLRGRWPIDAIDAGLPRPRSIALEVPQFATAAAALAGTPYLAMVPLRMANALAPAFDLVTWPAPVDLPEIEVLQAWHPRTHADPGCRALRAMVSRCWAPE